MLLHLLIVWLITTNFNKIIFLPPQKQEKTITLNLQHIITPVPKPMPKPIMSPPIVQPILEKKKEPQVSQEVVKRTILDKQNKIIATKSPEENNVTKVLEKPVKKVVKKEVKHPKGISSQAQGKKPKKKIVKKKTTKKTVKKKHIVKKSKPQRRAKRSKDPLANMLMNASTSMTPKRTSRRKSNIRMIKQFYGEEFNTFTPTQKKFIEKNLGSIYRITQRTLTLNGYPPLAVQTRQQGTNIVTFYLHPNGDISNLRLKRRIGYAALDKNTLHTIRIAYKDYPLPKTKTKITFYVEYNLY